MVNEIKGKMVVKIYLLKNNICLLIEYIDRVWKSSKRQIQTTETIATLSFYKCWTISGAYRWSSIGISASNIDPILSGSQTCHRRKLTLEIFDCELTLQISNEVIGFVRG